MLNPIKIVKTQRVKMAIKKNTKMVELLRKEGIIQI